MEEHCFIFPIIPGKSDQARQFLTDMAGSRRAEFERSEQRIGVDQEVWYLAALPSGEALVVFVRSPDFARALSILAQSDEDFDRWFMQSLIDVAGVDLDNLPDLKFPELFVSYNAHESR